MLINRAFIIAALMIVGLLVASISTWVLAVNPTSSTVATWSGHWILQRLPILVGMLMVLAGFRMLSTTRVPRPVMSDDDPAP